MQELMRIGELAAELGLNPKTIRYYEEIGLLPQPRRTPAGYRLYEAADRERLAFILTSAGARPIPRRDQRDPGRTPRGTAPV